MGTEEAGRLVRQWRSEQGLTLRQAGEISNLAHQTIHLIETNALKNISALVAQRLAPHLGVEWHTLCAAPKASRRAK